MADFWNGHSAAARCCRFAGLRHRQSVIFAGRESSRALQSNSDGGQSDSTPGVILTTIGSCPALPTEFPANFYLAGNPLSTSVSIQPTALAPSETGLGNFPSVTR